MTVTDCITKRRSCRKFLNEELSVHDVQALLSAAVKAPSGKNGQPWKFYIIRKNKKLLEQIANLTIYHNFVSAANALILVFLDKKESYNYIKDVQAIGASIENILLMATEMNLGACWIGEILNKDLTVKKILNINNDLDLMALIAVGHGCDIAPQPIKKDVSKSIIMHD